MFSYCIGVKFLHGTRLSAAVGRGVAVIEDFGIGVPQVPHPGLLPLLLLRLRLWRFAETRAKKPPFCSVREATAIVSLERVKIKCLVYPKPQKLSLIQSGKQQQPFP